MTLPTKKQCGECYLHPGETCDVCGAESAPRIGAAVCGVDCHPGDALCNNYCRDSRVKLPPPIALPVASVTTGDVRAVAKFLAQKLTAAREGKRGVMLSWEDAQGFALTLHAAADALAVSPEAALGDYEFRIKSARDINTPWTPEAAPPPDYCGKCGTYLAGGMIERSADPSECAECAEAAPPRSCCDESYAVETTVGKVGCPTHFMEYLRKLAGEPEAAPPRATVPALPNGCDCAGVGKCKPDAEAEITRLRAYVETLTYLVEEWKRAAKLRASLAPSRESGALQLVLRAARWRYAILGDSAEEADRAEAMALFDAMGSVASLERDAARMREAATRWAQAEDAYAAHDALDLAAVEDRDSWCRIREELHEARVAARFDALREARALTPSGETTTTPDQP
jgi:hypothetical protein